MQYIFLQKNSLGIVRFLHGLTAQMSWSLLFAVYENVHQFLSCDSWIILCDAVIDKYWIS